MSKMYGTRVIILDVLYFYLIVQQESIRSLSYKDEHITITVVGQTI